MFDFKVIFVLLGIRTVGKKAIVHKLYYYYHYYYKFYMTTRLCFLYCVVCINLGPALRALIAFVELLIF